MFCVVLLISSGLIQGIKVSFVSSVMVRWFIYPKPFAELLLRAQLKMGSSLKMGLVKATREISFLNDCKLLQAGRKVCASGS